MKTAIKAIIFFFVLIYTTSYAIYEFRRKNRLGSAAIVLTELLSAVLFMNYLD
jgi:hypothetical protein